MDANSAIFDPQLNAVAAYIPQNPNAAHAGWLSGTAPRLTMYVKNDMFAESAGTQASSFTLVRSNMNIGSPLTVTLSVSDSTEIQVPQTVTFAAEQSVVTGSIGAVDDNLNEPTRAVQIFATASTTGGVLKASEWVRVLQDTTSTPSVSISDVSVQEGTGGTRNAVFTVTLTSAATTFPTVSVSYATAAGTAAADSDYTTKNGTVNLSPNQRTATISVPIVTDSVHEANEQFFVRLSNPVNAVIADAEGIGTILNDDLPALSISDVSVQEGTGGTRNAVFTVTLTSAAATFPTVSVSYATAAGTATAGSDYTTRSGTVNNLTPSQRTATISVPITTDSVVEANEQFFVRLSNPVNSVIADAEGVGTILDDDLPALSISDVSVQEGTGGTRNAVFTVTLTSAATTFPTVSVRYATAAGRAMAVSDYTTKNGTANLYPNQRTATISIPITTDSVDEANEQFFVRLSSPVNAVIADGEGVGTILDDDLNPDRNTLRVWRPSDGTWHTKNYVTGVTSAVQFGLPDDVPVPGDYNGDGSTDLAVWRPAEGKWYVRINGNTYVRQLGSNGDIPIPADYNGDSRTDLAVYRPSDRKWWLRDFDATAFIQAGVAFGEMDDIPVPGDYNGDGRADLAVYRRSNGTWWVMDAVNFGTWIAFGQIASNERNGNDVPVPGDYNGDLLTDFAVWNSVTGEWKIRNSNTGVFSKTQWGLPGDSPQSNDFDGDGRTDLAVWRPSTGEWFVLESQSQLQRKLQWGLGGDWATYDRSRYGRRIIWRLS